MNTAALFQDMLNTVTKAVANNKPAKIHLLPMLRGIWLPSKPSTINWIVMRSTPAGLVTKRLETPVPETLEACASITTEMYAVYKGLAE